jgi:hypothetical protein
MIRRALLCLAVLLGPARTVPPITRIVVTRDASVTLDSLAKDARTKRVENAACLTSYWIRDSTLTVMAFSRAIYQKADSLAIYTVNGSFICPAGVPSIHSHVARNSIPEPSDVDLASGDRRGIWNLLMIVSDSGYSVKAY